MSVFGEKFSPASESSARFTTTATINCMAYPPQNDPTSNGVSHCNDSTGHSNELAFPPPPPPLPSTLGKSTSTKTGGSSSVAAVLNGRANLRTPGDQSKNAFLNRNKVSVSNSVPRGYCPPNFSKGSSASPYNGSVSSSASVSPSSGSFASPKSSSPPLFGSLKPASPPTFTTPTPASPPTFMSPKPASPPSFASSKSASPPNFSSSTLPRNYFSTNSVPQAPPPPPGVLYGASTLRRVESDADSGNRAKADPNDPQVRKLVYNMYRGMLDKKHDKSSTMLQSVPQQMVEMDEGVKNRVLEMMRQQEELKSGKSKMHGTAGPPPAPPPPPFMVPGMTPYSPPPQQVQQQPSLSRPQNSMPEMPAPPAALAGAMMKDKKPFTYTPGGLDLSEISPPSGPQVFVAENAPPIQSKSFRLLQNVVEKDQLADGVSSVHAPTYGKNYQQTPRTNQGYAPVSRGYSNSNAGNENGISNHRPSSTLSPKQGTPYRTVIPSVTLNGSNQSNNTNSALMVKRDSSPSPMWNVDITSNNVQQRGQSPISDDQSRLIKFISKEAADTATSNGIGSSESKKLYEGAKIPSRMFRHLQEEFSEGTSANETSRAKSPLPSVDKPKLSAGLLKLLQSDHNKLYGEQNERSNSANSSTYGEMEEYYRNGLASTGAAKENVLQELTSKYDSCNLQPVKPRAAPGKVFRYLQQQYDNEDNSPVNSNNNYSGSYDEDYEKPRRQSPSFAYLQNQYNDANERSKTSPPSCFKPVNGSRITETKPTNNHDLSSLLIQENGDPIQNKSYGGDRIPGRTFRMLQQNYNSHPSVFESRK